MCTKEDREGLVKCEAFLKAVERFLRLAILKQSFKHKKGLSTVNSINIHKNIDLQVCKYSRIPETQLLSRSAGKLGSKLREK